MGTSTTPFLHIKLVFNLLRWYQAHVSIARAARPSNHWQPDPNDGLQKAPDPHPVDKVGQAVRPPLQVGPLLITQPTCPMWSSHIESSSCIQTQPAYNAQPWTTESCKEFASVQVFSQFSWHLLSQKQTHATVYSVSMRLSI